MQKRAVSVAVNAIIGIRTTITIDQKIQFSSLGFAAISFIACFITNGTIPTPMSAQRSPKILFIADIIKIDLKGSWLLDVQVVGLVGYV